MSTCRNPHHDHTTRVDLDGRTLAEPIEMVCVHCHAETHYDEAAEYVHDDPEHGCYLIPERPAEATACTYDLRVNVYLTIPGEIFESTDGFGGRADELDGALRAVLDEIYGLDGMPVVPKVYGIEVEK